jgi:hypothetical protein
MSGLLGDDDSPSTQQADVVPSELRLQDYSDEIAPGADNDSSADSDSDRPHKRIKSSRELPPEAVAVFRSWLLSEKNFSHPVSAFLLLKISFCDFSKIKCVIDYCKLLPLDTQYPNTAVMKYFRLFHNLFVFLYHYIRSKINFYQ